MSKRKRTVGLIAFLKGNTDPAVGMPGCANYNHHHGGCLFCWADCDCTDDECLPCTDFLPHTYCKVEQGQRCGYFEKAVLPTAADIGLGERMYSLYEKMCSVSGTLERNQIRICPDCGTGLKPRQRYCEKCAKRRRRQSYRRARDNERSKRNS